ncbi:oligosaccharide flippase family protein [Sphingobium baderi]|uniref:oligosaccharide flippase family protein n=1 Tax=Sphingobium baderi TaxID=1332080 RepID=UPI002B4164AE|nr:oligosaccharide flippase family protein [Sphingobium baderi]WRD78819.1 oligosaccharide flippase family protein [Sphingobium baderi]
MLRHFLSVSVVFAIGVPLALGVNIVLARWLSIDQFGQYSFAIALATLIAIPVSGGLPLLLTREVSKSAHAGDATKLGQAVSTAVMWVLAASLVIAALAAALIGLLMPERAAYFALALALVPAISLMAVSEGVLKGLGKPAIAEASRQLAVGPILLAGVLLLSRKFTPEASNVLVVTLLTYALVALCTFFLVAVLSPFSLRSIVAAGDQLRAWAGTLVSFALISGMATLSTQIAVLVLGFLGADEQVAFLRVAERGAQLVLFPLMFVNALLGPRIVAAHRDGSHGGLRALSRQAARMTLAMSVPVAIVLLLFGEPLIAMTFGEDYVAGASTPLIILVIGQAISGVFGSPGMFLMMSGYEHSSIRAQFGGLSIMTPAVVILGTTLGALGAAIGVTIGLLAINLFTSLSVSRDLGFFPGIVGSSTGR